MLRFEHPEHLYALLLLPLIGLLFWAARRLRQRALARLGQSSLLAQLMPGASRYRQYLKLGLLLGAVALLVLGWANPQYGAKLMTYERKSVDVILAFDLSQSMLAEDITPSRLERARRFAQSLSEGLRAERLGLVYFAGAAFLQSPVTTDYSAIQLALRAAHPDMLPNQGTSIADALAVAEEAFEPNNKSHKALILITDGETHDEAAEARAKQAAENGLIIYTIGVGTADGGFIPIVQNGREMYKRDQTGNPVRSALNEEMLQALAQAGNGRYFNLNAGSEAVLAALKDRIDRMEKRSFEERSFEEYESTFQWFIGLAIALLLAEFLLPYNRKNASQEGRLFD